MQTIYLGFGSSMGDRRENIQIALKRLDADSRIRITTISSLYQSPHLGRNAEDSIHYPPHLNLAAKIETDLSAEQLLEQIQEVEFAGGRERAIAWGPRTIDIDILIYGDMQIVSEKLTIPHPGISQRAFVIWPLLDIDPELLLPNGRSLSSMKFSSLVKGQRIELLDDKIWLNQAV